MFLVDSYLFLLKFCILRNGFSLILIQKRTELRYRTILIFPPFWLEEAVDGYNYTSRASNRNVQGLKSISYKFQ